ncbi:hypothetical protein RvY_14955 [Ramazzottius varieornatus]|uniref:Uncharacterized protein n=1 Tax=Ramazzottius varieornatus TaxID=947166 RepID=A0A1D1VT64_RAMVA|nr:hypothetical protein RvY_14955 [Ramazzottius varieornatus]
MDATRVTANGMTAYSERRLKARHRGVAAQATFLLAAIREQATWQWTGRSMEIGPHIEQIDSEIGQPTQDVTSQYAYCQMDGFHFIPLNMTPLGLTRPVATKNECLGDVAAAIIA